MRKFVLLTFWLLCVLSTSAQSEASASNKNDSIFSNIATTLEDIDSRIRKNEASDRYKFYPTENRYNFLKLDTRTGRIEQVQWSLNTNEEHSITINNSDLSLSSGSLFELYPTQNMYQFLLLDKTNGRTWHVQWGMKDRERWMRRIY